jgi:crotonobetaine/carnitine-CoA ligase
MNSSPERPNVYGARPAPPADRMLTPDENYHDLATLIRAKARKNGSRPALRFPTRTLSYSELDTETDRFAAGLATAGVERGDRVAALLYNRPEFPLLWFALSKLGAVLVPLNTALKGELLRYELNDSESRFLVIEPSLLPVYEPIRAELRLAREWVTEGTGGSDPTADLPDGMHPWTAVRSSRPAPSVAAPQPWEPAAILYTSGTTGPPKGVVIPHEKYLTTPREIGLRSDLDERSALFTGLPLFHCNAQEMTALTALLNDLSAAFEERFHATTYWETAARWGATHVSLLISMVNVLYKQPAKPTDVGHGVRVALTAGATREVWPKFEERFGLKIIELYGMTECGCTTLMNPTDGIRVGSVGTPLGFVEAQIVDDHDEPVSPGTPGELVVRPRQPFTMFVEYNRKPDQTVAAWRNLWFHTGDLMKRDADGYYYFLDRKKDVIRRRGENLAPYDVETVLNQHPAVFESVVVGVPAEVGEEDVKGFIQLRPGAVVSPEELFLFAAERLPFFMVPRYLEFIPEIPKTANQKAQRYLLKGKLTGRESDRDKLGLSIRRSG